MVKNVSLTVGKCWVCGGRISSDWAKTPRLGDTCRDCHGKKDGPFTLDNIDLHYTYRAALNEGSPHWIIRFSFTGTQVMVNGVRGSLIHSQCDTGFVKFENSDNRVGEPVSGLGYWGLVRLAKQAGFDNPFVYFDTQEEAELYILEHTL